VRNLYKELLVVPPEGYRVRPIAATRTRAYYYLREDFLQQSTKNPDELSTGLVHAQNGDLFLGLDLAAHIIPHRIGELLRWKHKGTRLLFVVYDLLPVLEPAWFNKKTARNFRRWLRAVVVLADETVAISHTVRNDFDAWTQRHYGISGCHLPCAVIQLGGELNAAERERSAAASQGRLPSRLIGQKFILMVGTIEPRKAHGDVLDAYEQLWAAGEQSALVVAGNEGWKVDALIQRIENHPETGNRFYWLNGPSDDVLLALYQQCAGVIMASRGEGFGLPMVEAACFSKPVLARDLPIFREISGDKVTFFPDGFASDLLPVLRGWIKGLESKEKTPSASVNFVTWKESCRQLTKVILKDVFTRE
jgi:glycosyltransferase involved in cell wall biosynthesis